MGAQKLLRGHDADPSAHGRRSAAIGRGHMTEDRDKWRKYVHGVANRRIDDR